MNFDKDFLASFFLTQRAQRVFAKFFKVLLFKNSIAISSQSFAYKLFATLLIPFFKRISLKFISKPSL